MPHHPRQLHRGPRSHPPPPLPLRHHSKAVEEFKKSTSKWLKSQSPDLANFSWQFGNAAFSVSESNLNSVTADIQNQREHHRSKSFQDEVREFLKKNNLAFDET